MAEANSKYQELFQEAEALWQKISTLAHDELNTLVEGAGHEILMDIATDKEVQWDDEVKSIASLLYHQGEVVGRLDVLRQPKSGVTRGDS